jgi:hypothetical protein
VVVEKLGKRKGILFFIDVESMEKGRLGAVGEC